MKLKCILADAITITDIHAQLLMTLKDDELRFKVENSITQEIKKKQKKRKQTSMRTKIITIITPADIITQGSSK